MQGSVEARYVSASSRPNTPRADAPRLEASARDWRVERGAHVPGSTVTCRYAPAYLARQLSGALEGGRLEGEQVRGELRVELLERVHDDCGRVQAERDPVHEPRACHADNAVG